MRDTAVLSLPVLGFWLPFLGLFASLAFALVLVPRAGRRLWGLGRGRSWAVALLGFGAMWLPAALAVPIGVFSPLGAWLAGPEGDPLVGNTIWLLFPLCGPENPLLPTVIASAVYVAGAATSGMVRRPWPWVLGALVSALGYDLVMVVLSVDFIC